MVAKADASGQPWTMMVHLEHAAAACRAVVGAIRLTSLAFLAEAYLTIALDSEGRSVIQVDLVRRKEPVAVIVGRRSGARKNSRRIAPIQEKVEEYTDETRSCAFSTSQYSVLIAVRHDLYRKVLGDCRGGIPIQALLCLEEPISTITQTPHVVKPYTNARGRNLTVVQHPC